MGFEYEDDYEALLNKQEKVPLTPDVLKRSLLLILASLAALVLVFWIVTFKWFMYCAAALVYVGNAYLSIFVGFKVFKSFQRPLPTWVRITVSFLLGGALFFLIEQLARSHEFVRVFEKISASDNED